MAAGMAGPTHKKTSADDTVSSVGLHRSGERSRLLLSLSLQPSASCGVAARADDAARRAAATPQDT
eukprot:6185820-Pleurochrysis_carterae.AAC.3